MSDWKWLLQTTFEGLQKLAERGSPVPNWVLGGGTSLMIGFQHRVSRDIDAFIDDPQYLAYLDPGLGAEGIWGCKRWDRQANYLKLVFEHGEIDFIAAPSITGLPPSRKQVEGRSLLLEHPVEVCISKMFHRPRTLKGRDIFDIAVVDRSMSAQLSDSLVHLVSKKADLQARMNEWTPSLIAEAMAPINIMPGWENIPAIALERVREVVEAIHPST